MAFPKVGAAGEFSLSNASRTPHECVAIHSYTLLSEEFAMMCRIPAYEAFLRKANFVPTYAGRSAFCSICSCHTQPSSGY